MKCACRGTISTPGTEHALDRCWQPDVSSIDPEKLAAHLADAHRLRVHEGDTSNLLALHIRLHDHPHDIARST